jgi:hypothetical protein
MDDLSHRVRQVTESLLENESLTADLDDQTAKVLLDWVTGCAGMVAQSTAALDDQAAEEAMSPRLRAIRRLMRQVNGWVAAGLPAEDVQERLAKVLEQAAIIYEQDYTTLSRLASGFDLADDPQQLISNLRAFIEKNLNP